MLYGFMDLLVRGLRHAKDPSTLDNRIRPMNDVAILKPAEDKQLNEPRRTRLSNAEARAKTKELQDRFQQMRRPGGLPADKEFYDWLCGDV